LGPLIGWSHDKVCWSAQSYITLALGLPSAAESEVLARSLRSWKAGSVRSKTYSSFFLSTAKMLLLDLRRAMVNDGRLRRPSPPLS